MRNGSNTIHNDNGRYNIGKSLNDTMLGKTDWLSDLILVTKWRIPRTIIRLAMKFANAAKGSKVWAKLAFLAKDSCLTQLEDHDKN